MRNRLVVLFAVLDLHVWSLDQLIVWADQRFMEVDPYEDWLADLSTCKSVEAGREVVRKALIDSEIQLPDDIGDLMAGLVLVRLENGDIAERDARCSLIDIADAYGMTGVDPESAGAIGLDAPILLKMKADAETSMELLSNGSQTQV